MMNIQEVPEIIDAMSQIPAEQMEWQDHMLFIAAAAEYAERIKPLVLKYADRLPEKSTFLFKLGGEDFPQ